MHFSMPPTPHDYAPAELLVKSDGLVGGAGRVRVEKGRGEIHLLVVIFLGGGAVGCRIDGGDGLCICVFVSVVSYIHPSTRHTTHRFGKQRGGLGVPDADGRQLDVGSLSTDIYRQGKGNEKGFV